MAILYNPADLQFAVPVRADKTADGSGILDQHPTHAVPCSKTLQSIRGNMGPIRLRCALLFPMFGQIGKYRSRSAVLPLIGQHAAFGDGAEPMKVHAGLEQIFRIKPPSRTKNTT
jgi:hypothetical protein